MSFLDWIANLSPSGNVAPDASDRFTTQAPSSGALDLTPRFPGGVPLPRERPVEAGPGASDLLLTPPDTRRPAPVLRDGEDMGGGDDGGQDVTGQGLTGQDLRGGGLLGAIMGADPMRADPLRSALAALGGGLANVKSSPFKAQALANPLGAALQAGNKADDTQYQLFTQRLAALDRALRRRGVDVQSLPARRAAPMPTAPAVPGTMPFGGALAQNDNAAPAAPAGDRTYTPGEIAFPGQGTRETPYQPRGAEDYGEIASGSYYIHPESGDLLLKR
jgi:hypothetical protein